MSAITSAWSGLRIIMRFCALLCAQGLVAPAYSEDVIQFSYAADTASIVARGQIDVGAADRFQQFLDINRVDSGSTVYLHSPGGILTEGVKIGRIIRKRGLRTSISDGGTSSGACYSACAIAFVGGITRTIPPGSRYGVHRFRYSGVPDTALGAAKQVEIAQITSARLIQYFSEMGVDSELFTTSALTASNDMARPSLEQLKRWRVTTDSRPIALWSVDDSDGAAYLRGRLNDGNK